MVTSTWSFYVIQVQLEIVFCTSVYCKLCIGRSQRPNRRILRKELVVGLVELQIGYDSRSMLVRRSCALSEQTMLKP